MCFNYSLIESECHLSYFSIALMSMVMVQEFSNVFVLRINFKLNRFRCKVNSPEGGESLVVLQTCFVNVVILR